MAVAKGHRGGSRGRVPPMRRAAGPSPELQERSRMHPGHPHHPKTANGSRWPRPPAPPGPRDHPPPPARARCVTFEDEVVPPRGPPGRVRPAKEQEKQGDRAVPPRLSPRPRTVPDYVVRYPAIRSPRQREGYKGVFQDQLAEYVDLHRELRATCRPPGRTVSEVLEVPKAFWGAPEPSGFVTSSHLIRAEPPAGLRDATHNCCEFVRKRRGYSRQDSAWLEKQQRCEYLKKKLTHLKARIQEYDRVTRPSAGGS